MSNKKNLINIVSGYFKTISYFREATFCFNFICLCKKSIDRTE